MQDKSNLEDILLEEKIRREVREEMEIQRHAGTLFEFLPDEKNDRLLEAIAYFDDVHDADLDELSVELRERVRFFRMREALEDSCGPDPESRAFEAGLEMLGY